MEIGVVRQIDINDEMQQAYLSYAMSVIVARALPDARDGLKPVHRRIMYAMNEMSLWPEKAHKKSARIVGEVLGKYHPHGDQSVYDAMARMAQDFSMRYLLVDGQGNFGSIDGDPPAAMRYTEARLHPVAMDMLTDLDKDTVDFLPNFDDSLREPTVLPATIPNLLVNGASGIAVGMSTSVPPHNLGEVCDALAYMLESWDRLDDVSVPDLMQFIQGPDFPTGGVVTLPEDNESGLEAAYGSGRGRITVQAKARVEGMSRGRSRIIVTELPYQVNRSTLITRIADVARDGRVEGLTDLRDESDRQGNRIVIELGKNANPDKILQLLFKYTPLQTTFSIIILALVEGEPRMLSLKQALRIFLQHRLEVVRRRSEYDLAQARARAHILEGYLVALKNLDEIIRIIRNSRDTNTARQRLIKRFNFSELQANAILDLPLKRLAQLERKKIEDEYKEKQKLIKYLEDLLASPKKMRKVIGDELAAIKERYADERRTLIVQSDGRASLRARDLVPEEETTITVTTNGKVSRMSSGRMKIGRQTPVAVAGATTRHILYLITDEGQAAAISAHTLPENNDIGKGAGWHEISALPASAKVVSAIAIPPEALQLEGEGEHYLITTSRQGMVKKTALSELPGPSSHTFRAVKINAGDALLAARISSGSDEILLVTSAGQAIRFNEEDVRPMGLVAAGVGGIKLAKKDEVVAMDIVDPKVEVLLVADDGFAKRVELSDFPTQGRNGKGVIALKLTGKRKLVGAVVGRASERCILVSRKNKAKAVNLSDAPRRKRASRADNIYSIYAGDPWAMVVPRLHGLKLKQGRQLTLI